MIERLLKSALAAHQVWSESRAQTVNLGHPGDPGLAKVFGIEGQTAAGVNINSDNAMQIVAVQACVRLTSGTMGSMSMGLFRRAAPGSREKELDTSHPLYRIVHDEPNPQEDSMTFWEGMQAHEELRGNAFAEILRDGAGDVTALRRLIPDRMKIVRRRGVTAFVYDEPGVSQPRVFRADQIFHLMGMSLDGIAGMSRIAQARESLGLAMQLPRYGGSWYGNGGKPSGIFTPSPGTVKEFKKDDRDRLQKQYQDAYATGDPDSWQKTIFLQRDLVYQPISVTPEDAQFLETRKFTTTDIARMFQVPPSLIGDNEKGSTFASSEMQALHFRMHTILPRAVRIEKAINRQLLRPSERRDFFVEYNLDSLERANLEARMKSYQIAIMHGIMDRNEVRVRENLSPYDGGEVKLIPVNLMAHDAPPPPQPATPPPADASAQRELEHRPDWTLLTAEQRQGRADGRLDVRRRFQKLMREALETVVKREVREVRALHQKHMRTRDNVSFLAALEGFYGAFDDVVRENLQSIMELYAGEVSRFAAAEVDGESVPDVSAFLDRYMDAMGDRYAKRSRLDVQDALDKELAGDEDAIDELMDKWVDGADTVRSKADRIASAEGVRLGEAAAVAALVSMSVTGFRWNTVGENCPFCDELAGQIVGVERSFVSKGDTVGTGGNTITMSSDINHPPLHDGCDCFVTPERL